MTQPTDTSNGRSTPDGQLRQGGRTLLLAFYTALRSLKLYPLENTAVQNALEDLDDVVRRLLDLEGELEIRMAGDFIFVNATRLRVELDNYASFSHILAMFRAFDLGALRIRPGIEKREWQVFLSVLLRLADRGPGEEPLEELQNRLDEGKVAHLELERPLPEGGSTEQSRHAAKQVYAQGVAVTKDVIGSVRMGRTARLKRVKRAVQQVVDQVLNNETSMLGLTAIRDYDEYTFTHSMNVCIISVALGKKLGLSKVQLCDLGMTALLHDVGKARVPTEILNKAGKLDESEWKVIQAHPWFGALTLFSMRAYEEIPYRSILVAHEHHMKMDLSGYPKVVRPRTLGIFSRIVSVADAFDAATTRRVYQTVPVEPDEVLREMWENPKRGQDKVLVKALINLVGVYPIGTCIILDTFEVAVVAGASVDRQQLNRPIVRIALDAEGGPVPLPGIEVNLSEKDESGAYRRSIVKVTNPDRFGITVGDYFV
ncbi:MAG TPA: HD domain-containing phosphohydrolase [Gemmatimonadales bacterium]|nr:HD domain-containing phosphohydrolase [Gemmatimonadales bacterium]